MSIKTLNLNHHIQGKSLLNDVNVGITEAKLVGVIGPNGAGKSTLLKCLSGLIPTVGQVTVNGQPLESFGHLELAQIRAALPQDSSLNFPFIAKDIVAMSFALSNLTISSQQDLVCQCLGMMSANALADRNFQSLSGGEKQRIHLARVMAQLMQHASSSNMRLLFLDEPTAPLDMKHQIQLFKHLRQLLNLNITTIAVIHDINLAAACCDEIWVMQAGQLIKQGTPNAVISKSMMLDVFDVDVDVTFKDQQSLPVISHSSAQTTFNSI